MLLHVITHLRRTVLAQTCQTVVIQSCRQHSAVDYTVNPATGFPWATGPRHLSVPFNHLLPAWDAITGTLAAAGLLAAERHRRRTGAGQLVR
jgi:2-methylfumaryl-CoA isomerase